MEMPFTLLPMPPSAGGGWLHEKQTPPSGPFPLGLTEDWGELEQAPATPAPARPMMNSAVGILRRISTMYRGTPSTPTRDRHDRHRNGFIFDLFSHMPHVAIEIARPKSTEVALPELEQALVDACSAAGRDGDWV